MNVLVVSQYKLDLVGVPNLNKQMFQKTVNAKTAILVSEVYIYNDFMLTVLFGLL